MVVWQNIASYWSANQTTAKFDFLLVYEFLMALGK
jgi:hypothetical protein